MSLQGHLRRFGGVPTTSALPLRTDIVTARRHVSKCHSATLAARLRNVRRHRSGRLTFQLSGNADLRLWVGISLKRVWHGRVIRRTNMLGWMRAMVQERPVRVERRLSAILAADVAGYSRLMHD